MPSEKDLDPLLDVSLTFYSLVLAFKNDVKQLLQIIWITLGLNHPEPMHYHIFPFFNLLQTTECVACAK